MQVGIRRGVGRPRRMARSGDTSKNKCVARIGCCVSVGHLFRRLAAPERLALAAGAVAILMPSTLVNLGATLVILFIAVNAGIQIGGSNAQLLKGADLIMHQSNQWRYNYADPRSDQARDLIAQ